MRTWLVICVMAALFSGCYSPRWSTNTDGMALQCHPDVAPSCPSGLSCCLPKGDGGAICGSALVVMGVTGFCLPGGPSGSGPEQDMTLTPIDYWNFGTKTTIVPATMDPMLTGMDPSGHWRCPYRTPTEGEPNDTPAEAITTTLTLNNMPNPRTWNICPDQPAPKRPDVDALKFTISVSKAAKLIIDVRYKIALGDLDAALFSETIDDQGMRRQNLVMADLTAADNACVEANSVSSGTYYAVIRGAPSQMGDYNQSPSYAMNTYQFRLMLLDETSDIRCGNLSPDGGL